LSRALLIAWAAASAAGCVATSSTLGTPRTAGAGHWQIVPSAGWGAQGTWTTNVSILPGTGTSRAVPSYSSQQAPFLEAAARRGITDDLDLGLRLYTFGVGAEVKYAFHQTPWAESGIDLSVAPQAQASTAGVAASLPVLVGWHFSSGHELVLSPRVSWTTASVNGQNTLWAGGGLGFAIHLGESLTLMPELIGQLPVAFPGGVTPSPNFPWIQGGLAFIVGGVKGPRPPEAPSPEEAPPTPGPPPAAAPPEPVPVPLPPNDPGV